MNSYCDLLTIDDLARLLHRRPQGVARDITRHRALPPHIKVGKKCLFPRHAVEDWFQKNKVGEFPEGFRFFVPAPATQSTPCQPSLAEMLEAANAHPKKQKKQKRGEK